MGLTTTSGLFDRSDVRDTPTMVGVPITAYSLQSGITTGNITMYTVPAGKKLVLQGVFMPVMTGPPSDVGSLVFKDSSANTIMIFDSASDKNVNLIAGSELVFGAGTWFRHAYHSESSDSSAFTIIGLLIDDE